MSIRIFVTGGTFDKEYNELNGELYFKNSQIPDVLTRGRSRVPVAIRTLMMVDSETVTDEDRELIAHNCLKAKEKRILITHGTDTMVETARHIADKLGGREGGKGEEKRDAGGDAGIDGHQERNMGKTIVLTGAMVPYTFGSSDGMFNLGSAMAYVQVLPPGVYIAMNGRSFDWDKVRKNTRIGEFEETE